MKLYMKSLLIIATITVIGVGGFLAWHQLSKPAEVKANLDGPPIDELLTESIDIDPITTNLKDGGIIKLKFKLICSTAKNATELKKLSFQMQNTIIQYLNGLKKDDLAGEKGLDSLEGNIKKKLNGVLGSDYITKVYTTEKMIQ